MHRPGEEAVAVPPELLGVVHGRVGVLEQVVDVLAVLRVERDADAGGDRDLVAVDGERLVAKASRILRATRAADDASVTPGSTTANSSPPRRATVSLARTQAPRRCRHGLRAARRRRGGRRRSLTALKPSRSRNSSATMVALALRLRQGLLQAVAEQDAVGQPGERVVVRQPLELRLGPLDAR